MNKHIAAIGNPALEGGLPVRRGVDFFTEFIPRMVSILLVIGGLFFFFMFLLGAIKWITSGGDKANVEAARGQITAALIGLVVLFSTFAIAQLVETIFGINILVVDFAGLRIQ